MRIKLTYDKRYTVTEKGEVHVDVPEDATLADVYRKAYELDFAEFLPRNKEEHQPTWDFTYVRPEATDGKTA